MTDWREIERYRKDPQACRTLARALRKAHAEDVTEFETIFLQEADEDREWSTRRVEKLLQIRDDYTFITTIDGFSLKILIPKVDIARDDLDSDEDCEWIHALAAAPEPSYRRNVGYRVLRLARELHLID